MNKKSVRIDNYTIDLREWETQLHERSEFGLNVYFGRVECDLWEYLMSIDTIREKERRGTNILWKDFIRGNKDHLLEVFVQRLSDVTGLTFHIANSNTVPKSLNERLTAMGSPFDGKMVEVIVFGNNH